MPKTRRTDRPDLMPPTPAEVIRTGDSAAAILASIYQALAFVDHLPNTGTCFGTQRGVMLMVHGRVRKMLAGYEKRDQAIRDGHDRMMTGGRA